MIFCLFFGRIEDTIVCFRDCLTIIRWLWLLLWYGLQILNSLLFSMGWVFWLVFLCLSYSSELELHYSPASSTNWQQPSAKIATWKSLHWRHKSSVETPRFITYNLRFAPIKTCTLHTQPKQITSSPRWKNYFHLLSLVGRNICMIHDEK